MTLLSNRPARRLRPGGRAARRRTVRSLPWRSAVLGHGLAELVRQLFLVAFREFASSRTSGQRERHHPQNREAAHQFPAGHSAVIVFNPLPFVVLRL